MPILTMPGTSFENAAFIPVKSDRVQSIDILRGAVMIIMALDHVRAYFHNDAFLYNPTDLSQTSTFLFFTRFITHFCAPVFLFLAGISAYLNGRNKTKSELSYYLFTRGLWLIFVELIIISLGKTFNLNFPVFNFQVIGAIGISMMALAGLIYINKRWILGIAVLLIAGHNLLDGLHVTGSDAFAFLWSLLHEPKMFNWGPFTFYITYPILPWIGILALGYTFGRLYAPGFDAERRKKILLRMGIGAILLFIILRSNNLYGDPAYWSSQKNMVFSFLSFLNVTKYPPSLLYTLITLGPALIFLALSERPLNALTQKIVVYGRVPFFYYLVHFYLIHLLAMIGAIVSGYHWSDMILSERVNSEVKLKGYGFDLPTVYLVWIVLVLLLYPLCKRFDRYKRKYHSTKQWLSYF